LLDEAVRRLAGRYVVPFDATLLLPGKDGVWGQLGTSNCIHWIQTVPVLPRDLDGNPEDIPDRVEDHLADATRYLISNEPTVRFGRVPWSVWTRGGAQRRHVLSLPCRSCNPPKN
jgi:hypothetical protein